MDDGLVCDAYVSQPSAEVAAGKKLPAILFFMDAIGLRPQIEKMVDRIAEQGYYVFAPNLYYRSGRAPIIPNYADFLSSNEKRGEFFTLLQPVMKAFNADMCIKDTLKYIAHIDSQPNVVPQCRLGITGYCMGGLQASIIAGTYPERFSALGSWHGAGLANPANPKSPHFLAGNIKAECYFGHADNDANMNADAIKLLEQSLTAANVKYTSIIYTGAMHGYTMEDTTVYHKEATDKKWIALMDLFERNVKVQASA
ncbi:hypothetical protein SAMD00019534_104370 [Acytostelium subglobosum LB1]|uniref:hypothetical protein n=1 Tax=Acytostelium subglobosum LB1 TaxID=1410327 RepID=UPI000644ABB0|nr:hypothetical protein SAMD00019534_104370 [Acytostelium subglobosum LB1]GAM27262.1 hypothetical protein SAMD00019534_104370 [Acytostelium subglobosum LB1]|eukprot:XP_012749729.1 hypothetical protein SAMD00019534_104370 [Acytostelium subglobosum LB1]